MSPNASGHSLSVPNNKIYLALVRMKGVPKLSMLTNRLPNALVQLERSAEELMRVPKVMTSKVMPPMPRDSLAVLGGPAKSYNFCNPLQIQPAKSKMCSRTVQTLALGRLALPPST